MSDSSVCSLFSSEELLLSENSYMSGYVVIFQYRYVVVFLKQCHHDGDDYVSMVAILKHEPSLNIPRSVFKYLNVLTICV